MAKRKPSRVKLVKLLPYAVVHVAMRNSKQHLQTHSHLVTKCRDHCLGTVTWQKNYFADIMFLQSLN